MWTKIKSTDKVSEKPLEALAVDSEVAIVYSKKDNNIKSIVADQIKSGITEESDKAGVKQRAILLSALSDVTYQLATNLALPDELETKFFVDIVVILSDRFQPKRCSFAERYKFYAAVHQDEERPAESAARLRGLAANCDFKHLDDSLLDKYVMGMQPGPERDKLFQQNVSELTLAKAVDMGEGVRCTRAGAAAAGATPATSAPPVTEPVFKIGNANAAMGTRAKYCGVCGNKNHSVKECRFKYYKCSIGIIGGSGFDDPSLFENQVEREVTTPFGPPSDVLIEGQIKGVPCVLLARHGRKHQYQPSDVNYRGNIWALKEAGCTHILATTATGSLREEYKPGDLVVLDDFIDRTWGRKCTFFDRTDCGPSGVCHLPMRPAYCEKARQALLQAARTRGYSCHDFGTAVVIQGPRFSSRAESLMHKQWGGHLVNMTTVPEVVLAKEAGLSYAAVALVTDYDCWRENETSVSVKEVLEMFKKNVKKAADVIIDAVQILASETDHGYLEAHKELVSSAIMLKE